MSTTAIRRRHYVQQSELIKQGLKWCPACQSVKPLFKFGKNKTNSTGYAGHCKTCKAAQQIKYQKDNSFKINEKQRRYYRSGKGKEKDRAKRANNPDLYRALGRKTQSTRRARLHDAFVEVVDPQTVFERDEGICGICLDPVEYSEGWEVDHIIPLALGGEHSYDNVQLAHESCNRSKADRPVVIIAARDWAYY